MSATNIFVVSPEIAPGNIFVFYQDAVNWSYKCDVSCSFVIAIVGIVSFVMKVPTPDHRKF